MTGPTEDTSPAAVDAWKKKVAPLDSRAFELAIARWRSGAPLEPELKEEAERSQKQLREIARALRSTSPGVYNRLSETISEALLDLKYALTSPQGVSLRLNQYMDDNPTKT